ncbi:MAG: radical SAM family heme chaperone HemW [Lachnospiraceae bacterium]|nr:radical SAM family heme chaperone HemW [Lachnospiraceae bacterium]
MSETILSPAEAVKRPLGLYLHIPFCKRKCLYCDFLSAPAANGVIADYVEALIAQISQEAAQYRDYVVRTVFFGGGTPSLLSVSQMERIMKRIFMSFEVAKDAEITMESNPGTLDFEALKGYRNAGINRLSLGLQSACDAELQALGRIHSYSDFLENFHGAREAGFTNINVDLMSALPGQSLAGWLDTLKKVAELGPEHISAYSLIIEEGTPFWERYRDCGDSRKESEERCGSRPRQHDQNDGFGEKQPHWPALPDEDEERLMYEQTETLLQSYGYHRYEISNYAKAGKECLHNKGYWRRTDYLGLGLGAASLVKNMRWKMTDDLEAYQKVFHTEKSGRQSCREDVQVLTKAEQMEEFMFLGLRLTEGISAEEFEKQFGIGIRKVYGPVLDRLKKDELLTGLADGNMLKLTPRGVDLSNYVLAQFLLEEEE